MSYPDPYHPQQPPPGSYPPAPPGPYGYGYPPNGGYPPAQPYDAQQQPPYHPSAPVGPQPTKKRDNGNGWGWQIAQALLDLVSDSSAHGLGGNARDRVKTALMIFGVMFVGLAILILVLVLISK